MSIGDIWNILCVLMNIRLGFIWVLEMHFQGLL